MEEPKGIEDSKAPYNSFDQIKNGPMQQIMKKKKFKSVTKYIREL